MSDLSERRKKLLAKEEELHNAYMVSEPGSQEERSIALALEDAMADLDALYEQETLAQRREDQKLPWLTLTSDKVDLTKQCTITNNTGELVIGVKVIDRGGVELWYYQRTLCPGDTITLGPMIMTAS